MKSQDPEFEDAEFEEESDDELDELDIVVNAIKEAEETDRMAEEDSIATVCREIENNKHRRFLHDRGVQIIEDMASYHTTLNDFQNYVLQPDGFPIIKFDNALSTIYSDRNLEVLIFMYILI
jgi:hypothetical protein